MINLLDQYDLFLTEACIITYIYIAYIDVKATLYDFLWHFIDVNELSEMRYSLVNSNLKDRKLKKQLEKH